MFVGPVSSSFKPLVMDIEALRFPVGPFELQPNYTEEDLDGWMSILSDLPMQLQQAVDGMPDEQLQAPYRPDGWTRLSRRPCSPLARLGFDGTGGSQHRHHGTAGQ